MRTYLKILRFKNTRGSSFRRYFLYALGEVVLIMTGVMAALYLNNWNQSNKEENLQIEILTGIRNNLLLDTADIQGNIRGYEQSLMIDSAVVMHLVNKEPYVHKFMQIFYQSGTCDFDVVLHKAYFEEVKNVGLEIISSVSLRERISRLYDFDYLMLERIERELPRFDTFEKMNEQVMSYLTLNPRTAEKGTWYWRYYIPPDRYSDLLEDRKILGSYIFTMDHKRDMINRFYQPTLEKILDIIADIDKELEMLSRD
jgi:hypothetical protein